MIHLQCVRSRDNEASREVRWERVPLVLEDDVQGVDNALAVAGNVDSQKDV